MGKKIMLLTFAVLLVILIILFNYSSFDFTGKTVVEKESCTDSDGGIDFFVLGNITRCEEGTCTPPVSDMCLNNSITLIEFYCNGSRVNLEQYNCQNNCSNGICVKEIEIEKPEEEKITATCTDTDSIEYSIKGSVAGIDESGKSYIYEDSCSEKILTEYYCKNNSFEKEEYPCPYKCKDGKCVAKKSIFQRISDWFS